MEIPIPRKMVFILKKHTGWWSWRKRVRYFKFCIFSICNKIVTTADVIMTYATSFISLMARFWWKQNINISTKFKLIYKKAKTEINIYITNLFPASHIWLMMTPSNGNIFRVTGPLCREFTGPGESPSQRPVTRSFDAFFDLRLNKQLTKQLWGWWFETPSWPLLHQCNAACLNHWGWVIYASVKHTIVASDNGLSPIRRLAIIWSNAAILSNRPWGTYFSEIVFKI